MQSGITGPVPGHSRYLLFSLSSGADSDRLIAVLKRIVDGEEVVLGLGKPFVDWIDGEVAGLIDSPVYSCGGLAIPACPHALALWLRGDDLGGLVMRSLELEAALGDDVLLEEQIDGFKYDIGRDLTGYIDGTENPEAEDALVTAYSNAGGLKGSSFMAIQKWHHDLGYFKSLEQSVQDDIIGRRLADNEEFDEAPQTAHVKRAAQESYTPEAFLVRRSMPWADITGEGLVFVAFAATLNPFDAIMRRMIGEEDGLRDSLFQFSRCQGTGFFWCPPMEGDSIDLKLLMS